MDRLTTVMVRAALLWLLLGIILGGAMLTDRLLPGDWVVWFAPTLGHILFVGWFLQFAIGIAYWLLPRKRSNPARPLGYRENLAFAAVVGLNLGLALRVIAEPLEHAGHASDITLTLLTISAILQIASIATFVVELWPRVAPRRPRPAPEKASTAQS
jgi:hypothetical protein